MARKLIVSGGLVLALVLPLAAPAQARDTYGDGLEVPSACEGATDRITSRTIQQANRAVLCLVNDLRARRRVDPLRISRKLTAVSRAHTRDMVRRGYFSHTGPGGPTLQQRLRGVRYRSRRIGENLALLGNPTPVAILNSWIVSRQHWRNMTAPVYRYAGISIVARAALRSFPRRAGAATVTFVVGPRA